MSSKKQNLLSGVSLAALLALPLAGCATSGATAQDVAPAALTSEATEQRTDAMTEGATTDAPAAAASAEGEKATEMACGEGQCGAAMEAK